MWVVVLSAAFSVATGAYNVTIKTCISLQYASCRSEALISITGSKGDMSTLIVVLYVYTI